MEKVYSKTVDIKVIKAKEFNSLISLCKLSNLPTLQNIKKLKEVIHDPNCKIFGAFLNNKLVGCSCLLFDEIKTFINLSGVIKSFSIPNTFFCGTYVHPNCRGMGIGNLLYAKRLSEAIVIDKPPIIVELLGDGTKASVHQNTIPGYLFHIKNGFVELGYSTDEDAGIILIKPFIKDTIKK